MVILIGVIWINDKIIVIKAVTSPNLGMLQIRLMPIIYDTECSFVLEQSCVMDDRVVVVPEQESVLQIKFYRRKEKQKLLIQAILKCSKLTLIEIALLLDISYELLHQVYCGINYLDVIYDLRLIKLFLACFAD